MHLLRRLLYDAPWLQLMPDSSEGCMVLERLAAAGVRTCGRGTGEEEGRLRALVRDDIPETVDERRREWLAEGRGR